MFGLVLEGGGTKGAYHIGAYKAILELGIPVNCVVGASIGAVNGALFAQEDWEKADCLWDGITAGDIISLPQNMADVENMFDIKHMQAFIKEIKQKKGLDISPFDMLLRSVVDEEKIRSSGIGFGLATFNVTGVKEQQLFIEDIPRGKLVDYLLASACLPVFQPRKINNSVFIDGGVTNNLPVDMLVKAGYRNIICIEVGGVGISRPVSGAGCNIISVKCGSGSVGTLDFDKDSISEAKKLGYYDTLRTLGKVMGEKYYFAAEDYISSKIKYGDKILRGLQVAAEIFDIDKFKIYTVHDMILSVIKEFKSIKECSSILEVLKKSDREKAAALAHAILKSDSEILESTIVAGLIGNMFDAASAIAYFCKEYENN